MSEKQEKKIVAQVLVEKLTLIAESIETLKKYGISEAAMVLLIQAKTRLAKRDIKAVLDALRDISREVSMPVT